jgi:pimeloyl-ACP methyl ester carboxylesterase
VKGDYYLQDYLEAPDGASLYFQLQGDGEPGIVLCDGLGCDGFVWKYLAAQLRKEHRVLRWHYRGHGKSGIPEDRERIGMIHTCEDLSRIMDAAGMEKAVVFGHSMGVQVALEFHRRYPSRVAGLVLLCGSYGNPLDTFHDDTLLRKVFPSLRAMVERFPRATATLTRLGLSTELAVQFALNVEANRELMQRADLVPYFDHLASMDKVVFVRTLDALAEHTAWDHLPHINVPTLVVGGEKDSFTPLWLSRRMADAIPGSEFVIVPGGTHTAPLEQPALVGERIHRFLSARILGLEAQPTPEPILPPGPAPEAKAG